MKMLLQIRALEIIFMFSYIYCEWTDVCLPESFESEMIWKSINNSFSHNLHPDGPLILTPYLQRGEINKARQLARVPFTTNVLQITSFAGFFTVNEIYNSNHFVWYFPATNGDAAAPLIVWLAGGPGVSSLQGIFKENGPIRVINGLFVKMDYTIIKDHHVIFIDNPVGVGFSFTDHMEGYCSDQTQIGKQLYSSVTQFLTLFPELKKSPLYIAGISYQGKYAPAFAHIIHEKNKLSKLKVNLKGIISGNGLSDPVNQMQYGDYFYQLGIIDWDQKTIFKRFEEHIATLIQKERYNDAFDALDVLFLGVMIKGPSYFEIITGIQSHTNYLSIHSRTSQAYTSILPVMRESLHVGNIQFGSKSKLVREILKHDMMKSVAPWVAEVLEHYKVLLYNGQLDIIVPYPSTVNYLRNLNFTGADEYKNARREIWLVDGEVAGYKKKGGNLVEVLVRNAGHHAASDQPRWVLNLISHFIKGNI